MKTSITKVGRLAIVATLTVVTLGGVALAAPSPKAVEAKQDAQEHRIAAQETAADKKAEVATKLADAKLKACQKRETAINNIMSRIADRGTKQLDVFNTIAERTEKFYVDKGKTLTTYDALVTDVNAKKAAAQTAVDGIKSSSVTFKCDGTDPKGTASSFKDQLKAEIVALKAYKTAVKNLIVGVKSAQPTTSSEGSQQ